MKTTEIPPPTTYWNMASEEMGPNREIAIGEKYKVKIMRNFEV